MIRRVFQPQQVRVMVTVALLAAFMVFNDPQTMWQTLRGADPGGLALALALTPLVMGLRIWRWHWLVATEAPQPPARILTSYLMGFALGAVSPAGLGELGRALFLPVTPAQRLALSGKALADKLLDVASVVLLAGAGVLSAAGYPAGAALWVALGVAGFGSVVTWGRRWPMPIARLARFWEGLTRIPPGVLWRNWAVSLLGFGVLYGQLWVVFIAFAPDTPAKALLLFPLITLSSLVPLSLNGIGLREWVATVILAGYGLSAAVIFNAVLSHYLLVTLPPVLVGLGWWWRTGAAAPNTE